MAFKEILFGLTVAFWLFGYFVGVVPINEQNRQLEKQIEEMKREQNARNEVIRAMRLELEQLQHNDPIAIEKVLRERYGYCREDETIGITSTSELIGMPKHTP